MACVPCQFEDRLSREHALSIVEDETTTTTTTTTWGEYIHSTTNERRIEADENSVESMAGRRGRREEGGAVSGRAEKEGR